MIIRNISAQTYKSQVILKASVAFEGSKPREMFFSTGKEFRDFLIPDASPFLAALLLPCMKRGEDINIDGEIPIQLKKAVPKIVNLVAGWDVGFKRIKVYAKTAKTTPKNPSAVACFFSGGVDSFYTYLKHKKSVTHLVTIISWEIPPEVSSTTEGKDNIYIVAQKENLKVISVESNYKAIIEPVLDWEWNLGGNLAAVGLMLRGGFKKAFIPSGMRWDQLGPYGTHPDLDPLWSTETLEIFHDGCEYSRLEKVLHSISKSQLALKYLRVCTHNLKSQYNCNKCFKCLQTKIELHCAGALNKAKTFSKSLSPSLIKKVYYKTDLNLHIFGEDSLEYLKKHNKSKDIQKALEVGLRNSRKRSLLRSTVMFLAKLDKKYNHRKIYMLVFKVNPNHDRTLFFKMFANLNLIR